MDEAPIQSSIPSPHMLGPTADIPPGFYSFTKANCHPPPSRAIKFMSLHPKVRGTSSAPHPQNLAHPNSGQPRAFESLRAKSAGPWKIQPGRSETQRDVGSVFSRSCFGLRQDLTGRGPGRHSALISDVTSFLAIKRIIQSAATARQPIGDFSIYTPSDRHLVLFDTPQCQSPAAHHRRRTSLHPSHAQNHRSRCHPSSRRRSRRPSLLILNRCKTRRCPIT
jgi:hypothetical protein